MSKMIGASTGGEALGRFFYDFKHALLRHRKSRMALFFHIRFPEAEQGDFASEFSVDKLDFRIWLSATPPLEVCDNLVYQQLIEVQARFMDAADTSIFDFLYRVLAAELAAADTARADDTRADVLACAMKFQQFSSPAMAKGVEGTAFYRYHRLVSLNDVGGEPKRFSISVAAYHAATRERAKRHPHNLLATSTHDSKRSEDVRCRIDVLSEIAAEWKLMLRRWSRINRDRKREIDGVFAPSANDEYLLYQTLLGTWPLDSEPDLDLYRKRVVAYLTKAVREAKQHSSWVNANGEYEAALTDFIGALLAPGDNKNLFLAELVPSARRIAHFGMINRLALTLLKLTAPGVPDIYRGSELWGCHLVDPDHRRPFDYAARQALLVALDGFEPVAAPLADPRHKLTLIRRTLALGAAQPELFRDGVYLPLAVKGEQAAHACAYARVLGDTAVFVVVPRFTARLLKGLAELPTGKVWGDTAVELPIPLRRRWRHVLNDTQHQPARPVGLAEVLAELPVALLATEGQVRCRPASADFFVPVRVAWAVVIRLPCRRRGL